MCIFVNVSTESGLCVKSRRLFKNRSVFMITQATPSLATRCYASMVTVEFYKDMTAIIGTERGKSAFEKYGTGGV